MLHLAFYIYKHVFTKYFIKYTYDSMLTTSTLFGTWYIYSIKSIIINIPAFENDNTWNCDTKTKFNKKLLWNWNGSNGPLSGRWSYFLLRVGIGLIECWRCTSSSHSLCNLVVVDLFTFRWALYTYAFCFNKLINEHILFSVFMISLSWLQNSQVSLSQLKWITETSQRWYWEISFNTFCNQRK